FALAQEEFVLPESKKIASFPFTQLSGGIIVIKAQLDQFPDSLFFILDTGSGGISLDSATVKRLNLSIVKSEKTIRGIGGIRNVDFTNNHDLGLPGMKAQNLDFHINDYELLTSVYGQKIDGIIGYSFFRRHIVRIDYDEKIIEVYTPGNYRYHRGGASYETKFHNPTYASCKY
ncbi:MAG: clan AA aspartic protease, partial [Chitinophagaceae bacterium]|nr:clan AA aspartic protease [Chitinophagaceae bacterium]